MLDSHAAGGGDRLFIRLGIMDCPDPRPFDVEIWLHEKEKELEADKLSANRHEEQVTEARKATYWARAAFWAALVAALAVIALGILDHLPKRS
ncbi:MAG TPA: hypothetical protein VI113_06830 [Alphaproteobacteria bacterium]